MGVKKMWMSKKKYDDIHKKVLDVLDEKDRLKEENKSLKEQLNEQDDDFGFNIVRNLQKLAKELKIDTFSQEYQDIANRVFLNIGGRHSPVLKGYSTTAFLKDNPEELLRRLETFRKESSIITKKLEKEKKK